MKTSTGFLGRGASVEDVQVMKAVITMPWAKVGIEDVVEGKGMGIQPSGGIRTLADTIKTVKTGADRIGTTNAVSIMEEALGQGK